MRGFLLTLTLALADSQTLDAQALLVPVDGAICRLGGAAASALRAALDAGERDDELEYVGDQLERMRPLADGEARVIDGVGRWSHLVVSAAYPHDVNDVIFTSDACAARLRVALPRAFEAAAAAGVRSLAMTVIGTAYRIPGDLAVRAQADAIAAAARVDLHVLWAFREASLLEVARAAVARLGLTSA
jgi:O-acetyl-ADP-ribose deacetylase (regulator of RNase III)